MKTPAWVAILGVVFLLLASTAHAQTEGPSPFGNRAANRPGAEGDVYQPPAVFVTGAQVQVNNNQVQGSFEIFNNDQETVGDLRYRVDLLSPPPDSEANQLVQDAPEVYDQFLATEVFALIPGERKTIPFTYTPPRVPKADYRLRIQLVTSKGRELGWYDATANLGVEGASFVQIVPGTIELPEFPDQVIPPSSGPNVAPGSSFTLNATLQNIGKEAVTAQPVLERYVFDIARGREEKISLGEPVTLAAGESKEVAFSVTAPAKPEVYVAMLSLEDPATNTRISNWAEYRWVVRGLDADIVSARIAALRKLKGEIVEVQVDIVGPADAETTHKGTLLVELTDSQGTVGSIKEENLELTDVLQAGMARITLERDLVGTPGIKVTLFDQAGNILDVYEVQVPLNENQIAELLRQAVSFPKPAALPMGVWAGLTIAGVGILALIIWLIVFALKKRRLPSIPGGPLALLIIVVGLAVGGATLASNGITAYIHPYTLYHFCRDYGGEWCNLGGGHIVELFINSPVHQATYPDRKSVPVSFRVTFVACQNHMFYARNTIRYSPEGAAHSSWRPPAGTSWHNIVDALFGGGYSECSRYFCKISRYYSSNVNLSQLPPTAPTTTLQIMSVRGGHYFGPPPAWHEGLYDTVSTWPYWSHAVNLWLNFPTPLPTPTPTLPPTSSQCQNPYADAVVSYNPGSQGNNNRPENALGKPETGRNVAPAQTFASPGVGGSITLHMSENIVSGPGNDLRVHEVTFLPHIPESAQVFASQDGVQFTLIGTADNSQNCDCDNNITELDLGPLPSARYLKFVDTTVSTNEAFDLNGVEAIHCGETTPTPTISPSSDAVCSDGKDNDNDKRIDAADPACHPEDHNVNNAASYRPQHTSEVDVECSDTKDNLDPEDSLIDAADPGCHFDRNASNAASYVPADDSEIDSAPDITPTPPTKPEKVQEVD